MIKLVTFADGSIGIRSAGKRLVREAFQSGYFDLGAEHWTLSTLKEALPEFRLTNGDFITRHRRGLGLWVWKPAVALAALNTIPKGDYLCFIDAGCQIVSNTRARNRFAEYLEMVAKSEALFLQISDSSFGLADLSEIAWTKKGVIDYFRVSKIDQKSNQIQSGFMILKNCKNTQDFLLSWYQKCIENEYKRVG